MTFQNLWATEEHEHAHILNHVVSPSGDLCWWPWLLPGPRSSLIPSSIERTNGDLPMKKLLLSSAVVAFTFTSAYA